MSDMFKKRERYYADWRDKNGKRTRKAFDSEGAALAHEATQKENAHSKQKGAGRKSRTSCAPTYLDCPKCGGKIPIDDISAKCHEDKGVLLVHYDPAHTEVVLIDTESGLRHIIALSGRRRTPEPASRQMGGIIGPY
jgi:hypothetical protein